MSLSQLVSISGDALDPNRLYRVAIYQYLLSGLNQIEPLYSHVQRGDIRLPDLECCRPAKDIILEVIR